MQDENRGPSSTGRTPERGSALIFIIILMVTVGGLVTAHLGELNAEKRKIQTMINVERAEERAVGELERARNVVNAATYVNDHNTALWSALNSDPPYVPGTEVMVQRVGKRESEWYVLRATGQFQGMTRSAQIFVRERSPFSSYNLFVIDHPVGLSGAPRGPIHTNKSIDFLFPYGTYRDEITAAEGFHFKAGATPENTRIWGPANPRSAPMNDVTAGLSVARLESSADTLKVKDNLLARIELMGKKTRVDLYTPKTTLSVARHGIRRVFDRFEPVVRKRLVRTYTTRYYKIKVPVFSEVAEHVTRRRRVYTWQEVRVTRYRPTYEDRVETYRVKEPVWATRLIPRRTLENTWIETTGTSYGLTLLRVLIAEIETTKTSTANAFALGILNTELGHARAAAAALTRKPPAYAAAVTECKRAVLDLTSVRADVVRAFGATAGTAIDRRIALFTQAATLVAKDAATRQKVAARRTAAADAGPDVRTLENQLAAGSARNVATGFFALKAMTTFVEQRYIASTRLVTKRRIRRVKVGQQLVTYKKRVPVFSHYEDRHVTRKRRVLTGHRWVVRRRRTFTGWTTKVVAVDVPIYRDEPYTYYEEVDVPETLVKSKIVPTKGTVYIEKDIADIHGEVNGQMSIVSNGRITITDSIAYVDDEGNRRMQHGLDPDQTFESNPDYTGNSVLMLVASGDILYSTAVPQYIEINASMLTTGGRVSMQGINVSDDGKTIWVEDDVLAHPDKYVKDSIRRLGGIVSRKRPVATYVDQDNNVVAGFKKGVSRMDRNLVLSDGGTVLPPAVFHLNRPTWSLLALGKDIEVNESRRSRRSRR